MTSSSPSRDRHDSGELGAPKRSFTEDSDSGELWAACWAGRVEQQHSQVCTFVFFAGWWTHDTRGRASPPCDQCVIPRVSLHQPPHPGTNIFKYKIQQNPQYHTNSNIPPPTLKTSQCVHVLFVVPSGGPIPALTPWVQSSTMPVQESKVPNAPWSWL